MIGLMDRKLVPAREKEIGFRLRKIREHLGITKEEAARRVGLTRERWNNYEIGRTVLKFEVGLQVCRNLIVNEEWLATGSFTLLRKEALVKGIRPAAKLSDLDEFFFRQCLDLQIEPECAGIPTGTPYCVAFNKFLSPLYTKLIKKFFHHVRIKTRDSDSDEFLLEILKVHNGRALRLLANEARRLKGDADLARRQFVRYNFEFSHLLFSRFIGQPTPEIREGSYNWMRALANDDSIPIGSLKETILENKKSIPKENACR